VNIFVLHNNPSIAADMLCDKHVPKMVVESAQMMASACIRHGASPNAMPKTKAGTPYKGGYHNHPCTIWAGESRDNYFWLANHASRLCSEYEFRFGGCEHACKRPIYLMADKLNNLIPDGGMTPFAQAMPDEYKSDDAVSAYRNYYFCEKAAFAKWDRGRDAPLWWNRYLSDSLV